MPIKVACKCGQKFAAKGELAGKTVKCPKCGDPITIPAGQSQPAAGGSAPQKPGAQAFAQQKPQEEDPFRMAPEAGPRPIGDPFLNDLLLEAGVTSDIHHTGPRCPGCNAPIQHGAVLCIKCGFDFRTGQKMKAVVGQTEQFGHLTHGANAEDLIRRAEEQIKETPIETATDEAGDMLMATLLAAGFSVLTIAMVGLGYLLFRWVDVSATSNSGIAMIMVLIGTPMFVIGRIWIIVLAFLEGVLQGVLVLVCDCYSVFWCITHMNVAAIPSIMFVVGYMMYIAGYIMYQMGDSEEEVYLPPPAIERAAVSTLACTTPTTRSCTRQSAGVAIAMPTPALVLANAATSDLFGTQTPEVNQCVCLHPVSLA